MDIYDRNVCKIEFMLDKVGEILTHVVELRKECRRLGDVVCELKRDIARLEAFVLAEDLPEDYDEMPDEEDPNA